MSRINLGKIDEVRRKRHNLLINLRESFDNGAYVSDMDIETVSELDEELMVLWGRTSCADKYEYCYNRMRIL